MTVAGTEDLLRRLTPQVLGAVVRRYGNFDLAEDATQEALAAAAMRWPRDGLPDNPKGWLITVASRRLTDLLRSEQARRRREDTVAGWALTRVGMAGADERSPGETDDTLVLLFLCCHPSLSVASQIALTLRAVGGLSPAEIARALLGSEQTMTRRITRAKQSIKASGLPFALPGADELRRRLDAVLRVLYLIFNEGYASTTGTALVRVDLAEEAIRLARALRAALTDDSEVAGLLALMLLVHARHRARTTVGRVARPHGGARPQPVGPGCHRGGDRARHSRAATRAHRARTSSKRQSPPSTTRQRAPTRPTGHRSSPSTVSSCVWTTTLSSRSTTPSPSAWSPGPRPASNWSGA